MKITYQRGKYWVFKAMDTNSYEVRKDGTVASTTDSCYSLTEDGLSIAKARVDYLYERDKTNPK